jgi:hypothetical protein
MLMRLFSTLKKIKALLQHITLAVLPPQVTAAPLVPAARLRED